jgi:uncharacterized delta-60 repeat protein
MHPTIRTVAACALACCALAPCAALAAPGDLDPGFDGDGLQILPTGGQPVELLVQPDGKLVMAGNNLKHELAVWRFNPDGTPDRAFGDEGVAAAGFGVTVDAGGAALLPDGDIVVAGMTTSFATAVARFDAGGAPDKGFDEDGRLLMTTREVGADVVALDGGEIVLVGHALIESPATRDFDLAQVGSDGKLDDVVFDRTGIGTSAFARLAARAPESRLVVAGTSLTSPVVARYREDGAIDKTFAGKGWTAFGPEPATAVAVQPDGRVLLLAKDAKTDAAVLRLTRAGEPDPAFGDGGKAVAGLELAESGGATAMALRMDGRLYVAGTAAGYGGVAVARLDASGRRDPSFGTSGRARVDFGLQGFLAAAVAQPDGKLVVAAQVVRDGVARLALARVLGDPTPPAPAGPGPVATPSDRAPRCAGRRATLVGTPGRDRLRGTRRADVIVARGGPDRVLALAGNDVVCGGAGRDRLFGGAGRDLLIGGPGRDRIHQRRTK